jgi:acetyl esterase/lipase
MLSAGIVKPVDWTGVSKSEIQIPVRDGSSIRAVVYSPSNVSPGPLLIYFHGGGWTFGWPEAWESGFEVLTKQMGITCVGVAYRLSPEHVFPTAVEDACDSLEWCVENAGSLGADANKGIIVAGSSAGACLAAVASHVAVEREMTPKVSGVVLMSPVLVHHDAVLEKHREHYKSWEEHKDAMILDARGMDWFFGELRVLIWNGRRADGKQSSTNRIPSQVMPVRSIGQAVIRANRQRTYRLWGEWHLHLQG